MLVSDIAGGGKRTIRTAQKRDGPAHHRGGRSGHVRTWPPRERRQQRGQAASTRPAEQGQQGCFTRQVNHQARRRPPGIGLIVIEVSAPTNQLRQSCRCPTDGQRPVGRERFLREQCRQAKSGARGAKRAAGRCKQSVAGGPNSKVEHQKKEKSYTDACLHTNLKD